MLTLRNAYNDTTLNEMQNISANFKGAQHLSFPTNLPLLLFVDASNANKEEWLALHEGQIQNSGHGKVLTFEAAIIYTMSDLKKSLRTLGNLCKR